MNRLRQEYAIGHNVATFETLKAFLEVGQNRAGAEVGFAAETRRRNLRRIREPEKECIRGTRISTNRLVTARSALSLGLVVGSPMLSNKRLRYQSEGTLAARDPLKEACLARGVWMNS
jgi:hypothetical protein